MAKVLKMQFTFQSTLPAWGATKRWHGAGLPLAISIHAPRMGSDAQSGSAGQLTKISIHAPRMGSDRSGETARIF